jgi:ribA/ribD-fused uncharacterized protein
MVVFLIFQDTLSSGREELGKLRNTRFKLKSLLEQHWKIKSQSVIVQWKQQQWLPLRKDWEAAKDNVMREAVYAKFSQNPQIAKVLLGTVDEKLVEHTEKDRYWGDGGDGKGKNMLGTILMEVRDRLRKENK